MTYNNGQFTLIRASRIIDGTGEPPLERGVLLIDGDKISAIGTEEAVVLPEGARVQEFNYGDKTVLPGLVDCHVHLIGIGDGRVGDDLVLLPDEVLTLQAARNARAHLYSGVTTVRDCGAKNQTTFMLRKSIEMGITPGPRLVLSGRPIAIIGGHLSYFGAEATGVNECRATVRQLIKEGADFIKITATGGSTRTSYPLRPSFTVEETTAICNESHKFGKHVGVHATSSQGIENSLDAGVDTLFHCYQKTPEGVSEYRPDLVKRIVDLGVFVNYTIYQSTPRIRTLEEKMKSDGLAEKEQIELNEMHKGRDSKSKHFVRMRSEGVKLVCGSDSAWAFYEMGGFQHEIEAHVEWGMSPMEAIVAATNDSASSCWVDDQVGSLEVGKQADVLVVDGNPLQDIGVLKNVVDVFLAGCLVDRDNNV